MTTYQQKLAKGIDPDEIDPLAKPLPNYKPGSSAEAARAFAGWAAVNSQPGMVNI